MTLRPGPSTQIQSIVPKSLLRFLVEKQMHVSSYLGALTLRVSSEPRRPQQDEDSTARIATALLSVLLGTWRELPAYVGFAPQTHEGLVFLGSARKDHVAAGVLHCWGGFEISFWSQRVRVLLKKYFGTKAPSV